MTSIFVAKLDFGVDNPQLSALFETYGRVNKATVAMDRETGKSRGFGFVEMPDDGEAQEAIKNLDGSLVNGRPIAVKQAEDRSNSRPTPRPAGEAPRRDSRPNEGGFSAPREFSRPNSDDAPAPFVPEIKKEVRNKVTKAPPVRENEGPKSKKMEAYRKSGKDSVQFDDDDDFDEEIDLFGRNEDDELDEDYSKYLVNASDDDDEEYDDDDEYDDEEYEDDED